jgi:multicomponent Na+:H+ antiporter subunit G
MLSSGLLLIGAIFLFLAALGVVRMPDLFMRMQASTKAASLGIGCMLIGVAVHFGQLAITTRIILIIIFFLLTVPVAAHMIGRAAYFVGVRQWKGTLVDELRGRYDTTTHVLKSPPLEGSADSSTESKQ